MSDHLGNPESLKTEDFNPLYDVILAESEPRVDDTDPANMVRDAWRQVSDGRIVYVRETSSVTEVGQDPDVQVMTMLFNEGYNGKPPRPITMISKDKYGQPFVRDCKRGEETTTVGELHGILSEVSSAPFADAQHLDLSSHARQVVHTIGLVKGAEEKKARIAAAEVRRAANKEGNKPLLEAKAEILKTLIGVELSDSVVIQGDSGLVRQHFDTIKEEHDGVRTIRMLIQETPLNNRGMPVGKGVFKYTTISTSRDRSSGVTTTVTDHYTIDPTDRQPINRLRYVDEKDLFRNIHNPDDRRRPDALKRLDEAAKREVLLEQGLGEDTDVSRLSPIHDAETLRLIMERTIDYRLTYAPDVKKLGPSELEDLHTMIKDHKK